VIRTAARLTATMIAIRPAELMPLEDESSPEGVDVWEESKAMALARA